MEGEKDISKKGHPDVKDTETKSLTIGSFNHSLVIGKIEKIVAALYLLTSHIDAQERIRDEVRNLGLALLKDMYWFPHEPSLRRKNAMTLSLLAAAEALAGHLRIARISGLISEQNEHVLKEELGRLAAIFDIPELQAETIVFTDEATVSPFHRASEHESRAMKASHTAIKDKKESKRHSYIKRTIHPREGSTAHRNGRREKILHLVRSKVNVGIKDICDEFTDCSEKTIQRELTRLVRDKVLLRQGNKRWSRYSLVAA